MKRSYTELKQSLLGINKDISLILQKAESISKNSDNTLKAWKEISARIDRQMAEKVVHVAVVGSIKSGKSTLINSLLGGEYLKRGAGVVTSIVTKIRGNDRQKAILYFKTWKEVNEDLKQALVMFPTKDKHNMGRESFDIREDRNRKNLKRILESMTTEQVISNDSLDKNRVLIAAYLKGYDRVKDIVSQAPKSIVYNEHDFYKHKDFVGDESLAVYLNDVGLTLNAGELLDSNVEIADCQGSDSPNPIHLAMIQDYLLQTHLIIYVISSRTGLRQADIQFLMLIRKMGLLKNIIFVINLDISEHDSISDLNAFIGKVREELSLIKPNPEVFTFSTLYHLFKKLASHKDREVIPRRYMLRLKEWEEEKEMLTLSTQERERFEQVFLDQITERRLNLILNSHLERIHVIADGLYEWIRLNMHFLNKDVEDVEGLLEALGRRHESMDQMSSVIKDTIQGTLRNLKQELGGDADRFFDPQYGEITRETIQFIESYDIDYTDYKKKLQISELMKALYLIFQEFQQAINRYLAESVNLKLVSFISEAEKKIENVFAQVAQPFNMMIQDARREYYRETERLNLRLKEAPFRQFKPPDIEIIKTSARVKIPPLVSNMRYSARIKTEAIFRFGLYNTLNATKKLLKKPSLEEEGVRQALRGAIRRIRKEVKESITNHFIDYKENLKFQYLYRLIDVASSNLYEELNDRIRAFTIDLSEIKHLTEGKKSMREEAAKDFIYMEGAIQRILDQIKQIHRDLD
nr:hypothetical protein [Desulfobacterales bacterium]